MNPHIMGIYRDVRLSIVSSLARSLEYADSMSLANMIRQRLSMRRTLFSSQLLIALAPLTRHMMSSICSSDTSLRRVASASCMAASLDIQSLEVMLVCLSEIAISPPCSTQPSVCPAEPGGCSPILTRTVR